MELKSNEREYVADILESAFNSYIKTVNIRCFTKYLTRNGKTIPTPWFKVTLHFLENNQWKSKEFEAETIEKVREKVGDLIYKADDMEAEDLDDLL